MLNQLFLFNINGKRFLTASTITLTIVGGIGWLWHPFWWLLVLVIPTVIIGIWDMLQTENTIIRNFPFLGHFRYLLLSISPEIHQYFVENNTDGKTIQQEPTGFGQLALGKAG